jgi:hypothetical protein
LDGADDARSTDELIARRLTPALATIALVAVGCQNSSPSQTGDSPADGDVVQPTDGTAPDVSVTGDAGGNPDADASTVDGAIGPDGGAAAFAGTWKYVSGSEGNLCGGSLAVVQEEGFLDITASSSGDLLTVIDDGCPFIFNVTGFVASEESGQSCNAWAIPTVPTWTLTLQPDGTLREKIGGQVAVSGDVCTLSGGGTLVRQ